MGSLPTGKRKSCHLIGAMATAEGNTIYFCSKAHKDLYNRASYLSWQAVALLKEFAKTLKVG